MTAVGIGEVELKCKTPEGTSTVLLKEVLHIPYARANLFAMCKATDARAKIEMVGMKCRFLMGGTVEMRAIQQGVLWKIETVGEHTNGLCGTKTGQKGPENGRESKRGEASGEEAGECCRD
jgi:hypothetical protein